MSAAKRVAHAAETIRARWERDVESDPQTEAAQALEDAGLLTDGPAVAARESESQEPRRGPLWSLLEWSFWGAGMGDVFRLPLADTMLAAISPETQAQAEQIMADFTERRKIEKTGVTVYQEQRDELERLRSEVAALRAERHSTNESLSKAAEQLRADRDRIAELEKREAVVAEFVAARAEYITSIRNCHPDNGHDYDRWQGHAAARRQLAELLGLPVAWPTEVPASESGAGATQ
ncbi:hypothetical protein [Streptomyces scabiei]|uniref:hypothetical protein n=1 Tax=Streptomyces scabiei TaxID=1930 RepID=UPI0004E76EEA|nr:hypothetical protein [Streptomyces scabiei]KFG08133.1 hypothetical protein IQ61_15490 [Streptomyces scabiei]MDX3681407.1 hypothetical protein [Streptomyces scabiei]